MKKSVPGFSLLSKSLLTVVILLSGLCRLGAQNIDFGKSYINVTKGANGGTVETGDTLEIRSSFVVRVGTFDSCRYQDAVPAGTTYIPGTVRVLTNEGKIYKQFTDAAGDDCGWITGGNITINLGYNAAAAPATAFRRGRVINTHKPSFYGSACIMIASFRVRVTAATGSNISTGGGNMTYKSGVNPIQTFVFPNNIIRVYTNFGICSNSTGTNAIGTEFNGSFGTGKPRNRAASANVPAGYTYAIFTTGGPNDYSYGIANNTSTQTNYTTLNNWPKPDGSSPSHRVFSVWDIIGDHTGAASPTAGNPAADTVANSNAGYMLVINAAYRIDSAFQQTITGLCPNTYYEISCWMRNICSKCGCDSNGKGATNAAGPPFYIPTTGGDSSGVYPNLTFEVDGVDYYTTGNILYTGQWVKKGFTFLTGLAQTSFTLKYFNNAPGGGGNDWALDDISVATCSPNMTYSPSLIPNVCDSNTITIRDTVRCFFNNYVYYKWQRSTNGGTIWNDVTAPTGPVVPVWNGSAWEYVTAYTVPASATRMSNNGDKYRVVVATTASNLSDVNCQFTDQGNIITLRVIPCGIPLSTQLLNFSGTRIDQHAALEWTTSHEDEQLYFDIEKSLNGIDFTVIASINGDPVHTQEQNHYSFTDPAPLGIKTYYRVRMKNSVNKSYYTRTIQFTSNPEDLSFLSVINPFSGQLQFEINSASGGKAFAEIIDATGKTLINHSFDLQQGISRILIPNTLNLPQALYILRVRVGEKYIHRRVVKQNN